MPEKEIRELWKIWKSGDWKTVVDDLAERHPAIVATFLVQGTHDCKLTAQDCNILTNLLQDNNIQQLMRA